MISSLTLLINALTILAIVSALLVITSKSPVISVLFLIAVFVNVAAYIIGLGLGFIGLSYIVVYVGAVAVLFLFVIMMLNLQEDELNSTGSSYTQNGPLAVVLGLLFLLNNFSASSYHTIGSTMFRMNDGMVGGSFVSLSQSIFESESRNSQSIGSSVNEIFSLYAPDKMISTVNTLQINSLANVLYTNGGIWLMLLSFSLLLAIVSPIILTTRAFSDSKKLSLLLIYAISATI